MYIRAHSPHFDDNLFIGIARTRTTPSAWLGSARLGVAWRGLTWLNRSLFTAATQAISGATLKWPLWEFQSLLAPIFSLPIDEFAD